MRAKFLHIQKRRLKGVFIVKVSRRTIHGSDVSGGADGHETRSASDAVEGRQLGYVKRFPDNTSYVVTASVNIRHFDSYNRERVLKCQERGPSETIRLWI